MQPIRTTVRFADIVFDEGLYPRVEGHDPSVVQTYARDLEQIEAVERLIALNVDNVLLDGRQRMLAYKKSHDGQTDFEVPVWRYPISSPLESFRLACRLQDRGQALSNDDRAACAKRLYALGDQSQQEIADALGVSRTTVTNWLSRTSKEDKERKRDAVQALWQACYTEEEIAERVDVPRQTLADWLKDFAEMSNVDNSAFSTDFTPPLYNVWKQQTKSGGPRHQVPVFKVAYTGDPLRAAAVQRLGHPEIRVHSPAELASFIDKLHDCEFCRRHHGGRFAVQPNTTERS